MDMIAWERDLEERVAAKFYATFPGGDFAKAEGYARDTMLRAAREVIAEIRKPVHFSSATANKGTITAS